MIRPTMLPVILLVGLAGLAAQGCDLPNGEHGKTTLEMSLPPGPIVVGDTLVIQPQVVDPEGRTVIDPPIDWYFPYIDGRDRGKVELLSVGGDQAKVVGLLPGSLRVEISAREGDPRFTSDVTAGEIPIEYASVTMSLAGVGSDTVLDARGELDLSATAVDGNGDPAVGTFLAETQGRSVRFVKGTSSGVQLDAFGFGPDTVVVTHTACGGRCADTVEVDVEPVAIRVAFSNSLLWVKSLGPFQSSATVQDRNGYEVPGTPIVWHLTDTGSVLSVMDSLSGALFAQANGSGEVQVAAGAFTATQSVAVQQEVAQLDVKVHHYVAGLGTRVPAKYRAWDAGGTPVDSLVPVTTQWGSSSASIAVMDGAVVQTTGYGETRITLNLSQCSPFAPADCSWYPRQGVDTLRVVPEPDSVRAYPHDGSTTVGGIGATAQWTGNIYLPAAINGLPSVIMAVPLFWASLDPGVATIDEDGLVTAVSPGTARIVGTMGAAADTSLVTVTG